MEYEFSMQQLLSVVSGILFFAGFARYIVAILRKTTKPAMVSWLLWAALDVILIVGMYKENALNGQIVGGVLGGFVIAILAVKYGDSRWKMVDKFCLGGGIIGLMLLLIFDNATLSILTVLTVICLGGIPTFVSAWHEPTKEDRLAWTILFLSCVFAVAAIPSWTFADAAQPISFLVSESIMMFLLYRPRSSSTSIV